MNKPRVGQMVDYYPWGAAGIDSIHAAIVVCVHSDGLITVVEWNELGQAVTQQFIKLLNPGDDMPSGHFATIHDTTEHRPMPYVDKSAYIGLDIDSQCNGM